MSTAASPARRTSRPMTVLMLVAVMIVTSVAAAIGPSAQPASAAPAWTTTGLNLRSGPGTNYSVITVMPAGSYVEIVQNLQNGFYRVRYNGVSGWAYAQFLTRDGNGGGTTDGGSSDGGGGGGNAVVSTALNLRAGPSTGDRILTVMPRGATVTVTGGDRNGFLPVTYNGMSGWAYAAYLDTGASGPGAAPSDPGSVDTGGGAAVGYATTTTGLNLRTGPGTNYAVVTVMPGGASVEVIGSAQNGFYPLRYGGREGWASGTYLRMGGTDGGGGGDGWYSEQEIIAIIYAAADRWGQSREDMLRVARCESGLDWTQVTPPYQASGLFQFLPGTWATTPYADQNIFDPVANANAAGWMWSVGRRGEWVCQ